MLSDLLIRFRALVHWKTVERELEEELRFHFDEQVEKYVRSGLSPVEAVRRARLTFGGLEQLKEECRDARGVALVESAAQDVRHSLRSLRKSPAFGIVAALTLALAIGANTAIFSVIEAVMLRPLPYKDPGRLVQFTASFRYSDLEALKSQSRAFEDMAIYFRNSGRSRVTLTGVTEPESVQGGFVTANFFPLMGVAPVIGRWLTSDEASRRERVVVLSYGLWKRRFGASPDAVGKMLQIDGINFQVIGIMPAAFQFPARDVQFWAPITTNRYWGEVVPADLNHNRGYWARWNAFGRLSQGITLDQAQTELNAINKRLQRDVPDRNRPSEIRMVPLRVDLSANTRLAIYVLFGAVSFVLLIACSNVANLVLARGAARGREMAVRTALGAGRTRLIRQLFTESAVLALFSGSLGLLLATFGIRALVAYGPPDLPRLDEASLDLGVLTFTFAISVFAAILFGLAPAWKISRSDPNDWLKSGARGASGAIGLAHTRGVLVMTQFALSVVLLTGAGLLVRSFLAIEAVDLGFQPEHVLTMQITLPAGSPDVREHELDDLTLSRVRSIPGVRAVGAINGLFERQPDDFGVRVAEGRAPEPQTTLAPLTWDNVRGDYFQAMGARLLRGRFFTEQDGVDSPLVVVVDESMARRFWRGQDPIGKRLKGFDKRGHNDEWATVIGVIEDTRRHGRDQKLAAHIYEWYKQSGHATRDLVVRTTSDPKVLAATLHKVVRNLDQTAILSPVTTLEQELSDQLAPRRFQTWLLSLFSLMAMVLASVGIYGVMHYSVAQRTHEIGIRAALGAQSGNLMRMVIGQGLLLAVIGLGAGLAGSWSLTRLFSSLLFGVTPSDPITFAGVSILLVLVAILASSIPAWRAARVDPIAALRCE
jgi:predicted permease